MNCSQSKVLIPKTLFLSLVLILCASSLLAFDPTARPSAKKTALKKYESVIVRSNQMNVYGYDLKDITFKLKRATEILVSNQFERATELLEEIDEDLDSVEAKGPEHLRREQRLAWLEVFGDFIQQLIMLIVISLVLFRFGFVKDQVRSKPPFFSFPKKSVLAFSMAALFGAFLGVIRYGQSSWAFIDLQIVFVGISGLVGGFWAGMVTALINGLFRFIVVPGANVYLIVPFAVAFFAGGLRHFRREQALSPMAVVASGLVIGFLHSLFMYLPIIPYLPLRSWFFAIFFLTISEGIFVSIFFILADRIFKEEKRKETERELLRTRLHFLRAQINPHFLFNALNTVVAVCTEEGANRARHLIVQLSTFFRRITKEEGDFVSLQEELEYIDAYLNIEQARHGDRLKIERKIHLGSSGLQATIPILVLQPIIENAVKHGLRKKPDECRIVIEAKKVDSKIQITVEDNGLGFKESEKKFDEPHTGIGLKNIQERMNNLYGDAFQMSIKSILNQGTVVTLSFPASCKGK